MRVFAAVVVAAFVAMVAWSSSAQAVDVEIHGYPFGCKSADGETRKPKFGDVGGMYFAGLPQGRKACLETIDRMIYSCGANTTFISHDLNNQYADCLPIFEQQAEWCARHFELQRSKCDAGGTSTPAESSEAAAGPAVEPADMTMWVLKRSNLRSGPGTDHAKVGLLEVGDEVQVTGEVGAWFRIDAPGGGEAFVYAPLLTEEAPETVSATLGSPDNSDKAMGVRVADWMERCKDHFDTCRPVIEKIEESALGRWCRAIYYQFDAPRVLRDPERALNSIKERDGLRRKATEFLEECVPIYAAALDSHGKSGDSAEFATSAPAAETAQAGPLHGSIAFSQEADGGYAWGVAWSFDSHAGALAEARDQCREYGGNYCAEVGWFQDACGALAIGDGNGYGTGWGDTLAEARRDALAQCSVADCRVEVARCSQSQEAGGKGRRQEEDTVAAREPEKAKPAAEAKPAAVVLEPKCPADYFAPRCWRELTNKPGCHFWQNYYDGIMIMSPSGVTWSGSCAGVFAVGEGTLAAASENHSFELTGRLESGKKQGRWVDIHEYFSSVDRHEGPYVNGERNGRWVQSSRGGGIGADSDQEGSYLHGKLHGEWITHTPGAGQHGEDMCTYSRYSNGDLVLLEDC